MRILIAPNAFKGSLDSQEVAEAIAHGVMESRLSCICECFPIGDGGDGTANLLIKAAKGQWVETPVRDALGRKILTHFGLIDSGKTAVIEMANASGIRHLAREDLKPLSATSFGTGEQIKVALDKGVQKIILGMGGSATVDAGVGILKALGARFLDTEGDDLLILPEDLHDLASIDLSGLDPRIHTCEIIILCDVDNPLLGDEGAAKVFGPQKGASEDDIEKLNKALLQFNKVIAEKTRTDLSELKYGGTAGGAAAGLHALLNANLIDGIDFFLNFCNFNTALEQADLLITGEGQIDEQSLKGKGPIGVARRAKERRLPVIALTGSAPLQIDSALYDYFEAIIPISNSPMELNKALEFTKQNLERTARMLGNILALRRVSGK